MHRDVKPSNVLVSRDGRVVLLDFGVIAEAGAPLIGADRGKLIGTPAYMAPEQTSGANHPTAAADFYSVGVMLFEALTGVRPFDGSPEFVLASKMLGEAPKVRSVVPSTCPDLAALCDRLLSREPENRPSGPEILRLLGQSAPAAIEVGELLVGRDDALGKLGSAYERMAGGRAQTVFVTGESGIGKSFLVERFLAERADVATVLRGRCFERESVPYKALDDLVDEIAGSLRSRDSEEIARILPDDFIAAVRAFPVLGRFAPEGDPSDVVFPYDQQELQRRAFASPADTPDETCGGAPGDRLRRRSPVG